MSLEFMETVPNALGSSCDLSVAKPDESMELLFIKGKELGGN
jgi:hypothetical protein